MKTILSFIQTVSNISNLKEMQFQKHEFFKLCKFSPRTKYSYKAVSSSNKAAFTRISLEINFKCFVHSKIKLLQPKLFEFTIYS